MYGKEKIYNSNMCLYFLKEYIEYCRIPMQLIDMNIASDYTKLGKMLDLCKGEEREKVIEKTVTGEGIISDITGKFTKQRLYKIRRKICKINLSLYCNEFKNI